MWKEELNRVAQEKSKYHEKINNGATEDEVRLFHKHAHIEIGVDLPEEYLDFLREVNGIEFNGFILYGIDQKLLASVPNQKISGLIENNRIWYENVWQKKYIFIGESSISWFVFEPNNKKFIELNKPSGDVVMEFENCDSMIKKILTDSMM